MKDSISNTKRAQLTVEFMANFIIFLSIVSILLGAVFHVHSLAVQKIESSKNLIKLQQIALQLNEYVNCVYLSKEEYIHYLEHDVLSCKKEEGVCYYKGNETLILSYTVKGTKKILKAYTLLSFAKENNYEPV